MFFDSYSKKEIKTMLNRIHRKLVNSIAEYDQEIEEMKRIEKNIDPDDEKLKIQQRDNITFAEGALYDIIISRVELEAILALEAKGFNLFELDGMDEEEEYKLVLKKDGVNLNIEISSQTRLHLQELFEPEGDDEEIVM